MAKEIELRRHTDNDGDMLSPEGVRAALAIGASTTGGYQLAVSSGAQRATQAVACFLAGMGRPVPAGVVVEPGVRSQHEDRWRELAGEAAGGDLSVMRDIDREFVDGEAAALAGALRAVFARLDDGGRALVVGHSPTNEAAVLGLTGKLIPPLGKGRGVLLVADDGDITVTPLDS